MHPGTANITTFLMILCLIVSAGIGFWRINLFPKRYPNLPEWEASFVAILGFVPVAIFGISLTNSPLDAYNYEFVGQFAFLAYIIAYLPFFFRWHKKLVEREDRAKLEAESLQNIAARDALLGEITSFKKPPVSEFLAALQRNLDGVKASFS